MTHDNLIRLAKAYAEGLAEGLDNNSTELDSKNNELIWKQDAILALLEKGQHSRRYKIGDIWELNFDEIREAMDTLPSAEPERKTGKWIKANDGIDGHVNCTECFKTYDWDTQAQYYDFCPSCGAKMNK